MEGVGGINVANNENWYQATEKIKNAKINLQPIVPNEVGVVRPAVDTYPVNADMPLPKEAGFDLLLHKVAQKEKATTEAFRKLMVGESDNLHQAMIVQQESGLAFNLLLQTRNKLVESYQELFRMQI